MLKWVPIILHADTAIATLGMGVLLLFVPETIHSKYKLPVPYYLPFEEQETFKHYVITIIGQFICASSLSCAAALVVGLFLCVILHIASYLDIINDIVEKFAQEVQAEEVNVVELENCSKIIGRMVTDVIEITSVLSRLYTFFFLLIECAAFGSLIVFGLTFLVLHQQYAIAISILHIAAELYMVCFVSVKIDDKFSSIADNLYDVSWKERSFYA